MLNKIKKIYKSDWPVRWPAWLPPPAGSCRLGNGGQARRDCARTQWSMRPAGPRSRRCNLNVIDHLKPRFWLDLNGTIWTTAFHSIHSESSKYCACSKAAKFAIDMDKMGFVLQKLWIEYTRSDILIDRFDIIINYKGRKKITKWRLHKQGTSITTVITTHKLS